MTMVSIQLTGSNRGPWRVLVPVTRYELPGRLDALFHQRLGTLGMKFGLLKRLLRNSRTWIASDWFEEGPPSFGAFPLRPEAPVSISQIHLPLLSRKRRWSAEMC